MIRHQELKQKLKETEERLNYLDEENALFGESNVEFWRGVRSSHTVDGIQDDVKAERRKEINVEAENKFEHQQQHIDLASRDHVQVYRGGSGSSNALYPPTRREPLSSSRTDNASSHIFSTRHESHQHIHHNNQDSSPFPDSSISRNHIHSKIASPPKGGNYSKSIGTVRGRKMERYLSSSKTNVNKKIQTYNNNLGYSSSELAYVGGLRDSKKYSEGAKLQNSIFTIKAKRQRKAQKKNVELQKDPSIHAPPPVPLPINTSSNSFWSGVESFFGRIGNAEEEQGNNEVSDDITL